MKKKQTPGKIPARFQWPESSSAIESPAEEAPGKTETSDQPNRGNSKGQLPFYTNRSEKIEASE